MLKNVLPLKKIYKFLILTISELNSLLVSEEKFSLKDNVPPVMPSLQLQLLLTVYVNLVMIKSEKTYPPNL